MNSKSVFLEQQNDRVSVCWGHYIYTLVFIYKLQRQPEILCYQSNLTPPDKCSMWIQFTNLENIFMYTIYHISISHTGCFRQIQSQKYFCILKTTLQ